MRQFRAWLIERLGGDASEFRGPAPLIVSPMLGVYMLSPEVAAFERDMRVAWELPCEVDG